MLPRAQETGIPACLEGQQGQGGSKQTEGFGGTLSANQWGDQVGKGWAGASQMTLLGDGFPHSPDFSLCRLCP